MPISGLLVDLDSARELLRRAVPTWEEILEHLESSGGRLKFLPEDGTEHLAAAATRIQRGRVEKRGRCRHVLSRSEKQKDLALRLSP